MREIIHNKKCASFSATQQLIEVHRRLIDIYEKERILGERSAGREAHRYLLNARRLLAPKSALTTTPILDIPPHIEGQNDQLAA